MGFWAEVYAVQFKGHLIEFFLDKGTIEEFEIASIGCCYVMMDSGRQVVTLHTDFATRSQEGVDNDSTFNTEDVSLPPSNGVVQALVFITSGLKMMFIII
ncbi:hypothetical protein OROHE_009734 [Orobanche hederae]